MAKVHRMTLAEREAQIERHPETDTRPRYGDGTRALPGDVVRHAGALVRVAWHNRTQEVPQAAYEAVLAGGAGAVPLKDLRLEARTMSDNMRYTIQTEDGQEIATLVASGSVKAVYDQAEAAVWIAQVDSLGRRLHKGRRTRVGLDPLAGLGPLTLVVETMEGEPVEYRAVTDQGKPDPSWVVMPDDE